MKRTILLFVCALLPLTVLAEQNWKAVLRYDKQATKSTLAQRLKEYAAQDSHAQQNAVSVPSTKQQLAFAKNLAKQLKHMGASRVQVSKTGIVTADIPSTINKSAPVLALVAHLDTPAQTVAQTPQLHAKYTSGDIVLDKSKNISLTEQNSSQLLRAHGHDFLTSDGSVSFGAHTKAGLTIAMTLADYLLGHTSLQHGLIKIVLLPDAPSHAGAEALDPKQLGADYALILDGNDLGEIATANFSGKKFNVVFEGNRDIPLGQAVSSAFADNLLMAADFYTLLPRHFRPETTAGMQGYIIVDDIVTRGNRSTLSGHLRAFAEPDLQSLTQQVQQAFSTVKAMYPKRTAAELSFEEQFQNAQAQIPPSFISALESALRQEDIQPKRISVRDNTDFAVLTLKGLPALSLFTGVFHAAEPLEYVDVDVMEASLRATMAFLLSAPSALPATR